MKHAAESGLLMVWLKRISLLIALIQINGCGKSNGPHVVSSSPSPKETLTEGNFENYVKSLKDRPNPCLRFLQSRVVVKNPEDLSLARKEADVFAMKYGFSGLEGYSHVHARIELCKAVTTKRERRAHSREELLAALKKGASELATPDCPKDVRERGELTMAHAKRELERLDAKDALPVTLVSHEELVLYERFQQRLSEVE